MGKQKYLKNIEDLFKKSPIVSSSSISRIINSKKNIKQYSKQLIRNLILKDKIRRLTKGFYTIHDDISLVVFCFKPSYLGLQDSLSFHELWEQETIPIIITSRKIRQGIRKILGMNILIRRIDKKYLFGFEYYKHDKFYLPYSNIEKTFIDMVYFRQKMSKDMIKTITKRIDKERLNSYLKVYSKEFRKKVLDIYSSLLKTS